MRAVRKANKATTDMKSSIAQRWERERAAMALGPSPSWDTAITQHVERERPAPLHHGSLNGDVHVEGSHARRWTKKRKRRS